LRGKRYEAHVPAEQTPSKKDPWFSSPDENCERPQGDQSPTQSRAQDFSSLTAKHFSKHLKLRKRFEFQKISRQGQRLWGQLICIDYLRSGLPQTRLGITASSRYGAAHERNRFKRLVREAFRTTRVALPEGLDLNVIPRRYAHRATLSALQSEMAFLLKSQAITPLETLETPCR